MKPLLDYLQANPQVGMVLILAGIGVVVLGVFLVGRLLLERRRVAARGTGSASDSAESMLLVQLPTTPGQKAPEGVAARVDRGFARTVEGTGLGLSSEQAVGLIFLAGLAVAVPLYIWRGDLWLVTLGFFVGVVVPLGIFLYMGTRRRMMIQDQLPDAYFFLARSLRAGLSLEQAIALVGSDGPKPLADELKRCSDHMTLGLAVPAALQLAAKRIELADFDALVSVVTLHRQTGGNLALMLDRLATSTRDRNQYRGYFRSATALPRLSAIFLACAAPAILLAYALFRPESFALFFQDTLGMTMLAVAGLLELLGIFWIASLLRLSY